MGSFGFVFGDIVFCVLEIFFGDVVWRRGWFVFSLRWIIVGSGFMISDGGGVRVVFDIYSF